MSSLYRRMSTSDSFLLTWPEVETAIGALKAVPRPTKDERELLRMLRDAQETRRRGAYGKGSRP